APGAAPSGAIQGMLRSLLQSLISPLPPAEPTPDHRHSRGRTRWQESVEIVAVSARQPRQSTSPWGIDIQPSGSFAHWLQASEICCNCSGVAMPSSSARSAKADSRTRLAHMPPHQARSGSEEKHTSELQSPETLVCRLLLEK